MVVAIAGYGRLGKEVEKQLKEHKDIKLFGVFSKRNKYFVDSEGIDGIYPFEEITKNRKDIDVVINCMSSYYDLPVTNPYLASYFNTVDPYDIVSKIGEYKSKVRHYCDKSGKTCFVGCSSEFFMMSFARSLGVKEENAEILRRGLVPNLSAAMRIKEEINDVYAYTYSEGRTVVYVELREDADTAKTESDIINLCRVFGKEDVKVSVLPPPYVDFINISRESRLKLKDKTSDFEMHVKTSCVYKSEAGLLIRYARKTYELNKKGFTGVYTADDILHM